MDGGSCSPLKCNETQMAESHCCQLTRSSCLLDVRAVGWSPAVGNIVSKCLGDVHLHRVCLVCHAYQQPGNAAEHCAEVLVLQNDVQANTANAILCKPLSSRVRNEGVVKAN